MSQSAEVPIDAERNRWPVVERYFAIALDTPPESRDAMLSSDCVDEHVRADVRRLLARHDALSTRNDGPPSAFLSALNVVDAARLLDASEIRRDPVTIGRYLVERRLGRGASGAVYLARDPRLDRLVAIKVLSRWLSRDRAGAQRFMNEARAASSLDHPGIAKVYEIDTTVDGELFIVMAYLAGITLRERIGAGPLPVELAVRIATELTEVLRAAHAQGIVHRDIKPENILLTDRGACLLDFGIAKLTGETLTLPGATIGTAPYMSPEQSRGSVVDDRTDIWSLGVVLYEMLAGVRPFRGERNDALIHGIRHDVFEPLREKRGDVPVHIIDVVDRALAKDVSLRVQSATDMQQLLRGSTQHASAERSDHRQPDHPLHATETTGASTRPAVRSRRFTIAAVSAVPLVLFGLWRGRAADERRPPALSGATVPDAPAMIALLPFVGRDTSTDRDYLTAGLTAAVRRELSGASGVRLVAAEAVRAAVVGGPGVPTIAARLGAVALLRGTTRDSGSDVFVEAQLLRGRDGRTLWSGRFLRHADDEHHIVDSIRRVVVATLSPRSDDRAAFTQTRTAADPVAYDLYLRGRFASDLRTPQGLAEASRYFREAIARDSSLARAYVGLADVYSATQSAAPADRFRLAKPLVARALAADSTLAEAHRAAGWIAMWYDHDWATAERHLRRALDLDPAEIWAYHSYAAWLSAVGRTRESLALTRRATALDPLSSATSTHIGLHLLWNRQFTESIAVLEHALTVDTTWGRTHSVLGRAYLAVGRYDDALRSLQRTGYEYAAFEPSALLTYGLGVAGRTDDARARVAHMEARSRGSHMLPTDMMIAYLGIGDTARALAWAERLPDDRGAMFFLISDPIFDPLRSNPRFDRVVERLGLGAYAQRASARSASLAR